MPWQPVMAAIRSPQAQSLICEIFETDVAISIVRNSLKRPGFVASGKPDESSSAMTRRTSPVTNGAHRNSSQRAQSYRFWLALGKIAPEMLETACATINRAFVHETPPAALSLTNLESAPPIRRTKSERCATLQARSRRPSGRRTSGKRTCTYRRITSRHDLARWH